MADTNRQITLAARPVGFPKEADFKLIEAPVPEPQEGELLARILWLSVDPYMRGRISGVRSYADPVGIGDVIVGGTVAQVIASKHPQYHPGDIIEGYFGWQEYAVSNGQGVRRIDPELAPVSTALGVLGMPGLTAYFGLLDICNPQPGETVVVSGAAGAVGSLVGQIARIKGCRVIGIAGADEKIAYLTSEPGFDAAFNYHTVTDYDAKLRELCPGGIDVYFDNVGGAITDAVMRNLRLKARISICGQISQYNLAQPEMGPRLLSLLIVHRAKIEGFLVSDYQPRFAEGLQQMAAWLREGKLKYREEITDGLENAPQAFIGMLHGKNTGKQLVRVADE